MADRRGSDGLKIRTITVDFWGTLVVDGPGADDRYKRRRMADFQTLLAADGIHAATGDLDRAYDASGTFLQRTWQRSRDVPVDAHVHAILEALDPDLASQLSPRTVGSLIEAYARPALLAPPRVDPTARPALETLAARGYTLALVSNIMRTPGVVLRQLLERFGVLACFKHTTFSDEVGVRKPHPEIFHRTLRAVGGHPAEAVHVGDDTILDVYGALAAGMRAVQVAWATPDPAAPAPAPVIRTLADLPEAIAALDGSPGPLR